MGKQRHVPARVSAQVPAVVVFLRGLVAVSAEQTQNPGVLVLPDFAGRPAFGLLDQAAVVKVARTKQSFPDPGHDPSPARTPQIAGQFNRSISRQWHQWPGPRAASLMVVITPPGFAGGLAVEDLASRMPAAFNNGSTFAFYRAEGSYCRLAVGKPRLWEQQAGSPDTEISAERKPSSSALHSPGGRAEGVVATIIRGPVGQRIRGAGQD